MLLGFQESQFSLRPQLATPALTPNVSESVSGQAMSQMQSSLNVFFTIIVVTVQRHERVHQPLKYVTGNTLDQYPLQ